MNRLLIVILAALSMLGALSIDAYLPALPTIAGQFGVALGAAQQSLTAYVFAFAVMTLFYGTLSDSFGRRLIVLWSLFFYLLATIGAAWSQSLETLIVFRLLQGLSAGGGAVVARAMVADLFTGAESHKVMSYVNVVFGLAPALAPIIGGLLLDAFGWRAIFWFIALFTVALLVACIFALPESLPAEKRQKFQPRSVLASYWEVGSHPFFLLRSLSLAMAYSGVMIYVGAAPIFVIDVMRLEVTDFGWLFIPFIGGMTAGSVAAGWLSHRVKTPLIISAGFAIMVLAGIWNVIYSVAFYAPEPFPLWPVLPLMVFSFGAALCSPAMSMITLEMFPKYRGLAASLQTFLFMMLFALVSGLVVPHLWADPLPFAVAVLVGALLSVIFWAISAGAPVRPSVDLQTE
jgi:DHA1 family bicyclomycin/chloramphenicol resistance-like MFS transporter